MGIKGFKAFSKDMKCKDFQFEIGKEYEEKEAICCQKGFHLVTNPLDLLNYYDLCQSEFCEVEALGSVDKNKKDSKLATTKIKIGAKLGLPGFIKASIDFLLEVTKLPKGEKPA